MNYRVLFGVALLVGSIGISVLGSEKEAVAGYGCYGCHGCYGGCWEGRAYRVHHVSHHRWRRCGGYVGCYGRDACVGRRSCFGCYGSYRCGGRCYGRYVCAGRRSCYGCQGCYGCGGSCYGCSGCWGGTIIEESPAEIQGDVPTEANPVPEVGPTPANDQAQLNVRVPAHARVFVNELLTTSTGSDRRYVSRGLKRGRDYRYELRAEIDRDGRTVIRTKVVSLTVGKRVDVTFHFDNEGAIALQTVKAPREL